MDHIPIRIFKKKIKLILYHIGVAIVTLVIVAPLLWMFILAFHPEANIFTTLKLFKPTLDNFRSLTSKDQFLRAFLNSLGISSITTFLALLVSFPAAYVLARHRFKGRTDLTFMFFSGRMTPPIAMIIPFIIVFSRLKILDSQIALIIAYLVPSMAYAILILIPFISGIPVALEEAAQVDGCSKFAIIFKIILPLSRPGLSVAAIFSAITLWNEFFFAFTLTSRKAKTLPVLVQSFLTFSNVKWGEMMAMSLVIVIPLIIFVFAIQRYLVTGLTLGAIEK